MTEKEQSINKPTQEQSPTPSFDIHAPLSVTSTPHIKTPTTVRSMMLDVMIALLPAIIWGLYVFGMRSVTVVLVATISAVLFEGLYQIVMKKPLTVFDCSACLTGLLIGLLMPANVPFYIPIIGSFFAIVIVKQLFGGLGKNFMNPAIAAHAFLTLIFPKALRSFPQPFDIAAVAATTPLQSLKSGILPESDFFDLFLGVKTGAIGEISALLLLAGGIYLLVRRVIAWHIPVAYLGTVALLTFAFPQNSDAVRFMLSELTAGALMLGVFYMATDPVTSPVTAVGRLIYGVGCGLITVFIRYFGGHVEGVTFAILIMNALVFYIDLFTKPRIFGRSRKIPKVNLRTQLANVDCPKIFSSIPILVLSVLLILLAFFGFYGIKF